MLPLLPSGCHHQVIPPLPSAKLGLSPNSQAWLRVSLQEANLITPFSPNCSLSAAPPSAPLAHLRSSPSPFTSSGPCVGAWSYKEREERKDIEGTQNKVAILGRTPGIFAGGRMAWEGISGLGLRSEVAADCFPAQPLRYSSCFPGCTENPGAAPAAHGGAPDCGHSFHGVPLSTRWVWGGPRVWGGESAGREEAGSPGSCEIAICPPPCRCW